MGKNINIHMYALNALLFSADGSNSIMNGNWGHPDYVSKKRQGMVKPAQPMDYKRPKMDTILRNKLYMKNNRDVSWRD